MAPRRTGRFRGEGGKTAKIRGFVQKEQKRGEIYGNFHRKEDGKGIAIFGDLVYNREA